MKPILSICIPCNKRLEYIRKTLNSIYELNSDVSLDEYEVIVSDNDSDHELFVLKNEYKQQNFHYYSTNCEGFLNSFYSLTYGEGEFLLLHNSQELFKKGSLQYIINLIRNNREAYLFFSSGFLLNGNNKRFNNFDSFVKYVSYWSTWSNAFGIWKNDFDSVKDTVKLNLLFPHTSLLLTQDYYKDYLVCDVPLFETQFVKGRSGHNKFHAFSYEFPMLIKESFNKGFISYDTKRKILHDILYDYLPLLYFNVKIAKREYWSSEGFSDDIKAFYPKGSIWIVRMLSIFAPFKAALRKMKRNRIISASLHLNAN